MTKTSTIPDSLSFPGDSQRGTNPGDFLSHLILAGVCLAAGLPLIVRAFLLSGAQNGFSMLLFLFGLIGLYTASGVYHALDISEAVNTRLRKIDHSMIYIRIGENTRRAAW